MSWQDLHDTLITNTQLENAYIFELRNSLEAVSSPKQKFPGLKVPQIDSNLPIDKLSINISAPDMSTRKKIHAGFVTSSDNGWARAQSKVFTSCQVVEMKDIKRHQNKITKLSTRILLSEGDGQLVLPRILSCQRCVGMQRSSCCRGQYNGV